MITTADADEYPASSALDLFEWNGRILECFPGHLQQQALLRIHARCLALRDLEEPGIKKVDVGKKASPSRIHLSRHPGCRLVESCCIPAVRRNLAHRVCTASQELPERLRIVCPGQTAGDTDDRDAFQGSVHTQFPTEMMILPMCLARRM